MHLRAIYRPTGEALEYAKFALNLYRGCGGGCRYCYNRRWHGKAAPTDRVEKASFHNIKSDLSTMDAAGERGPVHISFVGDPYDLAREEDDTRAVLELFRESDVNFQILTKGGTKAVKDFDLYRPDDWFGCTLTFASPDRSRYWEPGAALPEDRLAALEVAKKRGLRTWASIEPVVDPVEALRVIRRSIGWVDLYKIGRLNHFKRDADIHWDRDVEEGFVRDAVGIMDRWGLKYYLKQNLRGGGGQG